ncbi:hypothetical protein ZIOFF_062204 [Zingiber officinale]|uniref:Tify domain-containing protein n=1 Tax=Zingiber officinale TaxID=94328 RepID=A0A8J5F030_ZINOF|nr:hypothetical protein ZIOFF_062204 [Zingiber officinale]
MVLRSSIGLLQYPVKLGGDASLGGSGGEEKTHFSFSSSAAGLKNSSASKRSPLPGMSGNLDPFDGVNPAVIESFPSHHIHSMSVGHQYEEADCSNGSHGIEEEGIGAVENWEMEADGLSGPSHLGDTQPLVTVQPGENQLTLSFQGEVYVFDSVSPEKVQAVLLLLGGREMQVGSNPFPSSSIPTKYHSFSIRHEDLRILFLEIAGCCIDIQSIGNQYFHLLS